MNCSGAYSPPCQGGVAAPSTKWSRSEEARTGWSITSYVSQCVLQRVVWLTTLYVSRCRAHAARPSAALRWLRDFLLMPQPPLAEGNALDSNSVTAADALGYYLTPLRGLLRCRRHFSLAILVAAPPSPKGRRFIRNCWSRTPLNRNPHTTPTSSS